MQRRGLIFLQKSKIQAVGKSKKMYFSVISFQEFLHFPILAFSENVKCFVGVLLHCEITTYSRQKFSGLSWMVKRYYVQDYLENFRNNTEIATVASDFIRPSIESSLTRREKKTRKKHGRHGWGQVAFYKLLTWTGLENSSVGTKKNYMEAFDIFPCYMMKFLCYSCSQLWAR